MPVIKSVSPNVDGQIQIIYGNQNWFTHYRGVSPEFFDIKRWFVLQGAVFTQDDVDRAADVCVIGKTVRDQLFGADNPIGKVMRVNGLPCTVVATLQPKGLSVSGQDQDDTIIMPFTTVQKKIKGVSWLDDILCSAVSPDAVKLAGQQVAALLRDRHHLRPEEEDDFNIRNPEDIIQAQLAASRTLTILLVAIASISLLVGGIGIMNVMLVSVTERTREIGVRLAVGATEEAIQLQFLGESIMLSLVGGLAGVLAGDHRLDTGRSDAALAHAGFGRSGADCRDVLGCGGRVLRLLPCAQSGTDGSYRGPSVRVNSGVSTALPTFTRLRTIGDRS